MNRETNRSDDLNKETDDGPEFCPDVTPPEEMSVGATANKKPELSREQAQVHGDDGSEVSAEAEPHTNEEENITAPPSNVVSSSDEPGRPVPFRPRPPQRRVEVPGAVRVGGSPGDDDETMVASTVREDLPARDDVMVTAHIVEDPEIASLVPPDKPWWRKRRNHFLILAQIAVTVALVLGLYFGLKRDPTPAPEPTSPLFPTQAPSASPAPTQELTWRQVGQAVEGNDEYHYFGTSVAITPNGTTIGIGASPDNSNQSYIEVYQLDEAEDAWTLVGNRIPSPGNSSLTADVVFLNENADSIIALTRRPSGLLQTYNLQGTSWIVQQSFTASTLTSANVSSFHHLHVSSDGSAAVMAFSTPTYPEQVVQVYELFSSTGNWREKGSLFQGKEIGSTYNIARMVSVSRQAREVVIGGKGEAVVYHYGRDRWITPGSHLTSNTQFNTSSFGRDVVISGDGKTVAISDPNSYGNAGSVTVFRSVNVGEWTPLGRVLVGDLDSGQTIGTGSDEGNLVLSDDGNIVGVNGKIGNLNPGSRLKTFHFNGDDWDELHNIQDFNTDQYPCVISGDGTTICCGSPFDLTYGDDVGNVTVYRLER